MKKKNKKTLVFLILLFFLVSAVDFVYALEITYPRVPGATPPQDFVTTAPRENILPLYVKYFFNLVIWAAGFVALGALIYGGILYLLSTGKPQRMASAREQISAAFFGLLLLLSSYLVLKTINPDFTILKLPSLQPTDIKVPPYIEPPKTTIINSSIEIQMPFGRVIDKLFETYVSDYPAPQNLPDPRMLRIKNIARAIIGKDKDMGLADRLKKQNEDLKELADKCSCQQTKPEKPCGSIRSGNTTWECDCGGCSATKPVTSDPCKNVRTDIQKTEEQNLKVIYKGTEIVQFNKDDTKKKITTSLTEEQVKTEEEVRSLKDWLDRLKRAEKFIKECPLRSLSSLSQFYSKKDVLGKQGVIIRDAKFWDDISIRYYTGEYTKNIYSSWYFQSTKEIATDFATFYCSVSGTMEQIPSYIPLTQAQQQADLLSEEEAEELLSEETACSKEAPVGEIIDRAKRTAQLLIDKLEQMLGKTKELTEAVDKLQVLISQCSSQRGCERRCTCFHCGCGTDPCIDRCQGWAYACADSSGPYPSECKKRDEDTPCPYEEIDSQLKEVQRIWQEIKDIIEGKKITGKETSAEKVEKMGIIPLINTVIPEILSDLDSMRKKPIKECGNLFNAAQAKGAIIPPKNRVLRETCRTEALDINTGEINQTSYGDCFEECYLETGQDKHRECVWACLNRKSQQLNDPDLPLCFHELNFYCCP